MCRAGVKITNKNLLRHFIYSIYRAKIYFGNSTMFNPMINKFEIRNTNSITFLKNTLYYF